MTTITAARDAYLKALDEYAAAANAHDGDACDAAEIAFDIASDAYDIARWGTLNVSVIG